MTRPAAIVCDERNRAELEARGPQLPGAARPRRGADRPGTRGAAPADADLARRRAGVITFTSGTAGEPKAVVHGQRYVFGQALQAEHWLGARAGELVWCTAASGWSKSARNVFIAPWLRGAPALLHDARFDPAERLEILERERVGVLCMAPTEFRVIAGAPSRGRWLRCGARRRRRGARRRGARCLPRCDRAVDPRRLRADRDRADDGAAGRREPVPGSMGGAAGRPPVDRRGRAVPRPG